MMDYLDYARVRPSIDARHSSYHHPLPVESHGSQPVQRPAALLRAKSQDISLQFRSFDYDAIQAPASGSSNAACVGHAVRMPPKRNRSPQPSDDSAQISPTSSKEIKSEYKPDDFSSSVKRRLQTSSRTGQACDRCKIRKIRCDGLLGGCSPCIQNQTECRTTDRITGRAAPRGYVEGLEARVQELERLLSQHGISGTSLNGAQDGETTAYNLPAPAAPSCWNVSTTSATYAPDSSSLSMDKPRQGSTDSLSRAFPPLRTGFSGENYLGVSSGNSHLSSVKGTALSILGMEIDVADFISNDMDEPDPAVFHPHLYNKSYQSFLQSSLNINPRIDKVDLPIREEGLMYTEWYFRMLNPFLPVLHRPSHMKMLLRMYDDPSFRPSIAQSVMVHMVFAIMFFQLSSRNLDNAARQAEHNHQSNMHYHFSLGRFYQLMCSHTLEDAQAMTLLCAHLRNFPKPGASWTLTSTTMGMAIELGMNRSAKHIPSSEPTLNALQIEMRKRVFWGICSLHVTLSGKLGRPIHIRMDDLDIEFPDPVDDELLSETGLDTSRPGECAYSIGLQAYRLVPAFMEMYSTIYAVKRNPKSYIDVVKTLEARLARWIRELPDELTNTAREDAQENRVFYLYTQAWTCEFRLLMHHPSTSMTDDIDVNTENLKTCVAASRDMLGVVAELQKFKSLDTTWYNVAVYVMAITTTLYAAYENRRSCTQSSLTALRGEMDVWLDIMGDAGILLGSGMRLREAVRTVIDSTLGLLQHTLVSKPVYTNKPYAQPEAPRPPPQRMNSTHSTPGSAVSHSSQTDAYTTTSPTNTANMAYIATEAQSSHQQTPYPIATQYQTFVAPPPATENAQFMARNASFSYSPGTSAPGDVPLLTAFATHTVNANQLPQQQQQQQQWSRPVSHHGSTAGLVTNPGTQSWQNWTHKVASNLEPLAQDDHYASGAHALMQLGGREMDGHAHAHAHHGLGDLSGAVLGVGVGHLGHDSLAQQHGINWPLNIFDFPHHNHGGS